jgi:hypothetical protein
MKRLPIFFLLVLMIMASCSKQMLNEKKVGEGNPQNNSVSLDYEMFIIKDYDFDSLKKQTLCHGDELISKNPSDINKSNELNMVLTAGNHIDAGDLTVSYSRDYYYIIYKTYGGWSIDEISLYLGPDSKVPVSSSNVPVPDLFPVKEILPPGAEIVILRIKNNKNIAGCPVILANALVSRSGQSGETAWGHGNRTFKDYFNIPRWGFVIDDFCAGNYITCAGEDQNDGLPEATQREGPVLISPLLYNLSIRFRCSP